MKDKLKQLKELVLAWAEARNLIKGSDPKSQCLKTVSELGELGCAINLLNPNQIIDGVGDVMVTMIIVCAQIGIDFDDLVLSMVLHHPRDDVDFARIIDSDPENIFTQAVANMGLMADDILKSQFEKYGEDATSLLSHLRDICIHYGFAMEDALLAAYDEIKDRTGVMFNGAFIKADDARYEAALASLGIKIEQP